jgi:hypothetical protein
MDFQIRLDLTSGSRDCHGYRKTCGLEVTGLAGTGTVVDFGTPQHTAYPYRGIAGIPRVYYNKVSVIFTVLKLVFSHIYSCLQNV